MDSGRLPAYRSSYLLRFHPYPRVEPSIRERIMASSQESIEQPASIDVSTPHHAEYNVSFTLNQALNDSDFHHEVQSRQRRLSMSTLVIDLALLLAKKLSIKDAQHHS
ncbi:hypothetical protein BS17DRAFT_775298 [Gyrodon lividus]|nr:hypothetical protein BS17DRAFT_775298 [Gyrodon lividus]